jgi:hypothetical protein
METHGTVGICLGKGIARLRSNALTTNAVIGGNVTIDPIAPRMPTMRPGIGSLLQENQIAKLRPTNSGVVVPFCSGRHDFAGGNCDLELIVLQSESAHGLTGLMLERKARDNDDCPS